MTFTVNVNDDYYTSLVDIDFFAISDESLNRKRDVCVESRCPFAICSRTGDVALLHHGLRCAKALPLSRIDTRRGHVPSAVRSGPHLERGWRARITKPYVATRLFRDRDVHRLIPKNTKQDLLILLTLLMNEDNICLGTKLTLRITEKKRV